MEWISVEDSFPKHGVSTLVCGNLYNDRNIGKWHQVLCYNRLEQYWYETGEFSDSWKGYPITHWQLLTSPEPPKE